MLKDMVILTNNPNKADLGVCSCTSPRDVFALLPVKVPIAP